MLTPTLNKVYMRKTDDCLTACLATLLDIEYELCPYVAKSESWVEDINRFLSPAILKFIYPDYLTNNFPDYIESDYGIGVGQSPRGNFTHAVIVDKDFNIIHDPMPNVEPIASLSYVMVVI
jgi:hypothetical protein